MFRFALLVLLSCAISVSAGVIKKRSASHSGEYGGNGGSRFSQATNQLDGPITAIRIREYNSYIAGIQVRYGKEWSDYEGGTSGELHMFVLQPGELIIQVSGKADSYIRKLKFLTNFDRRFSVGSDVGNSFSAMPIFAGAGLIYISGRSSSRVDALSFHWNIKPKGTQNP